MEDVMVRYDGTVRNSLGDVIQFLYGEDGFDGTAIETQFLDTMFMNDKYATHSHTHLRNECHTFRGRRRSDAV